MNTDVSLNNLFQDTSNSIRGKLNSTNGIKPINYPSTINTIPVGIIVPNGEIVEYTPSLSMVGDMATGVFVNLEDKTIYTNLVTELNNANIIDSVVVYKGVTSDVIILSKNENNEEIVYNLHNLKINSSGMTLTDLELEQTEGFVPKRLVKLDDKIFALLSIGSNEGSSLDDNIDIKVFNLASQGDLKVYERTFGTSSAYRFNYNMHYDGNIAATQSNFNYFIYYSFKASYSNIAEADNVVMCNIAIPKDFNTLVGTKEFSDMALGSGSVLGDVTDIIPIEGVYKNRMYVSITNKSDNNKMYAVGLLGGTANSSHSVVTDLLRTGGQSRIINYNGKYYLINLNTSGTSIQYSEITLTNTSDTISTTCGSPVTLKSFSKEIFLRNESPISVDDKMIFTFSYKESPNKVEYFVVSPSLGGSLNCSNPYTFSTTSATKVIDVLPNGKVFGIKDDDYTAIFDLNSDGSLTTSNLKIATPSESTIDGIIKTSAAKGEIGLAYILPSQE